MSKTIKIDLRDSPKVLIMGIQGSGKTTFAKQLVKNKKVLVYTPHWDEWEEYREAKNVLIVKHRDFERDFSKFLRIAKELGKKKQIEGIVIDELDLLVNSSRSIKNKEFNDMVINHRHYNLFLVLITRRPSDIPAKIWETSKYIIIFMIEGDLTKEKMRRVDSRIRDLLEDLDYTKHNFIIKEIGREPILVDDWIIE